MRFLFDQNLSRHLVDHLRDAVPGSVHVTSLGLEQATDREVWEYARDHDLIVVSKDSDFRQLAFLHGAPPKVVWLRVGNASTPTIVEVLLDHLDAVDRFQANAESALLILPTST